MRKIYKSMEELIGNTPLIELSKIEGELGLKARLLVKLELFNPTGSAKDRCALYMIDRAEKEGLIKPALKDGDKRFTIIEATSGNTGISLAAIGAKRGYDVIIVMPDSMSKERIQSIEAYGAKVVLTSASLGMKGTLDKAAELKSEIPGSFIPGQFENQANPKAHYNTTGPEIWENTDGKVDVFVAGVGTGGTVTGTGKYLKEKNPEIEVIAVEPEKSPLLSEGHAGSHGIQGIGANFVPAILDREVYDRVITVADEDAKKATRVLAVNEGMLVGISSGAALHAAIGLAKDEAYEGKTIVALLPDGGGKYFSTGLFDN